MSLRLPPDVRREAWSYVREVSLGRLDVGNTMPSVGVFLDHDRDRLAGGEAIDHGRIVHVE